MKQLISYEIPQLQFSLSVLCLDVISTSKCYFFYSRIITTVITFIEIH